MSESIKTQVALPDGTLIEWSHPPPAGWELFKVAGDDFPHFVHDGQRYRVAGVERFGYVPFHHGPMQIVRLELVGPPVN